MKRFIGVLVVLAGVPACSIPLSFERSVANACEALFEKYAPNTGDDILQECEVFYTHHASEAQKEQLQCLARVSVEAAKVQCVERLRTVVLEPRSDDVCPPAPPNLQLVSIPSTSDANSGESARDGAENRGVLGGQNATATTLVALGEPQIIGEMDRTRIIEVVASHASAIRDCYKTELAKSPTLAGKMSVKFVIAKDGSVPSARTTPSTLGSGAVNTCVARQFEGMKFPKPNVDEVVIIRYPLVFTPPS